ncbi:MAG TPA: LytR family transcriptional regulator [Caldithrix abyssi]|uniref:LytR family transcriptional regulator n=1 Tax=Caldithrix abyssi TaxID=187145 RepID=A0A7V5PQZ6_CALAY|nr:LytR family transcriptional regulator [Caldithrix abyssi]
MRHRRRLSSQTLKRQKSATQTIQRPEKSGSGVKTFLKVIFYLLVIALIGVFVYKKVLPKYLENKENISRLQSKPTQSEKPKIPVLEKPAAKGKPKLTPIQKKIQVEVLNGCGEQGIAKILSDKLIAHNYDVVNSGNYLENGKTNFNVAKTRLIDQINTSENLVNTQELAKLLGVDRSQIESFENPSPIADITIIIGKDYKSLPIFKK